MYREVKIVCFEVWSIKENVLVVVEMNRQKDGG